MSAKHTPGTRPRRLLFETGQRFGRLLITGVRRSGPNGGSYWECRCDCGALVEVRGSNLKSGQTGSCGCLRREVSARRAERRATHGLSRSSTYDIWRHMISRCANPAAHDYPRYGGRGITVCDRWSESFPNFVADMGERPSGLSLDRIDNDGPYSPDNCRWATNTEQCRNKGNNVMLEFQGERLPIAEWADRIGVTQMAMYHRIRKGWTLERMLTTPLRRTQRGYLSLRGCVLIAGGLISLSLWAALAWVIFA